ncbi:MAG: asparagine synthetase B family protein, partial [Bacteroidota bacterium]
DALLLDAVSRQMIADVPLGVFLSGGLDSSIIAALATRHSDNVRTFSLGFENKLFDESDYALAVAKHIGTEHTRFEVNAERLQEVVEDVLSYIDEPFADASASNMFILSRLTRQHVTVALSGDGADELFGGYSKHYGEFRARQDNLLNAVIDSSGPLLRLLPGTRNSKLGRKIWQLQKYARDRKLSKAERYWAWCCVQLPGEASSLLRHTGSIDEVNAIRGSYLQEIAPDGDMNDVFRADLRLVLDGDMLRKVDLMSMANSLEVRVPFLDHTLVEWAANLPADWKVTAKQRKRILQDVGRPLLPELIYNRPKQGFEVPLRDWMRGPLRPELDRLLFDRDFIMHQGLFRYKRILELRDAVDSGQYAKEDMTLWALLTFQRFWERWF